MLQQNFFGVATDNPQFDSEYMKQARELGNESARRPGTVLPAPGYSSPGTEAGAGVRLLVPQEETAGKPPLAGGKRVHNLIDCLRAPIYSRFSLRAYDTVPASIKMFGVRLDQINAREVTNLVHPNRLPDPQWFLARSLRIGFGVAAWAPERWAEDTREFIRSRTATFLIGQKAYFQGPLAAFPFQGAMQLDDEVLTEALWDKEAPNGHFILQGQFFDVELTGETFHNGPHALDVYAVLEGILFRDVQ